jgi:hypothetical protein
MDIEPQTTTKPISDDQELAKVLAGVSQQADDTLQFEETPVQTPVAAPVAQVEPPKPAPVMPAPTVITPLASPAGSLEDIKKDALLELRPLVDKLDISPEEKFDTYLLLIRSTDDKALIAPAHTAAQAITDEARRAQALLDVIKEIDYLSSNQTV